MNMNFQQPPRLELQQLSRESLSPYSAGRTHLPASKRRMRYLIWPLSASGFVYLALHASVLVVAIAAAVLATVLAAAVAVCIYVQNETSW